jgi:HlyD family secretion protein
MQPIFRYLPLLVAVCCGFALLVYALWPRPIEVEVVRVTRGPLQFTVDEDGKTRVKERYIVSTPLMGQLTRIELEAGDQVEAGKTVLATIQPTDPALLDARFQAESEARVKSAESAIQQSEARVTAAREAHGLAVHQYERAKGLSKSNAISKELMDAAEHQERIAAETLRAALFGLQVAKYELDLANAAFVRTRPVADQGSDRTRLEIRSPVSGRVLRKMQESAAVVAPGQPLLEVGNTQELEMEIDVLSADAAQIRPGAQVLIEHWGGETPLKGRVRLVEPSGFTKISALGVEEQRVNVIADFDESPERLNSLGDAYRIEARIVVWEASDALQVPAGGLFRIGSEWAAFVVDKGRAELRSVNVGRSNGRMTQVLHGLADDDIVVAYPSDQVRNGIALTIKAGP